LLKITYLGCRFSGSERNSFFLHEKKKNPAPDFKAIPKLAPSHREQASSFEQKALRPKKARREEAWLA